MFSKGNVASVIKHYLSARITVYSTDVDGVSVVR